MYFLTYLYFKKSYKKLYVHKNYHLIYIDLLFPLSSYCLFYAKRLKWLVKNVKLYVKVFLLKNIFN